MKKLLVLLCLMLIGTSVYGQKRYVHITLSGSGGSNHTHVRLSGYIPTDMESSYTDISIGSIIDELGQKGYVLEQFSSAGYTYNKNTSDSNRDAEYIETFIMSKSSTPSGPTISKGDVNTDGEINIADVNEVISLILGIVREHPEILKQIKD